MKTLVAVGIIKGRVVQDLWADPDLVEDFYERLDDIR